MGTAKDKRESLIIKFEDLVNRDVQKNDLHTAGNVKDSTLLYSTAVKIAENSFFSVVYKQAFEQMAMITKQSLNPKQHDIQNIIAFTGRRGTGKTSAMLSFANFITSFSILREDQPVIKCKSLPAIDASHLDDSEDVLSIVLTNIIDAIDDEINTSDKSYRESRFEKLKTLREKACELLSQYADILKKGQFDFESSYHYTKGISEKIDIENDFSRFISDYIKNELPDSNAFLVITIDDVDMALEKPINIMKCIHKYFMKPNIIVMITTELSFLLPEMQKTFYRNLCVTKDPQKREDISIGQVQEFLKKMLPFDNRITMPSWRKKDYIEMFPILVRIGNKTDINSFDENFPKLSQSEFRNFLLHEESKSYMITPKILILMMIANRTKIYLDVSGNKYHFMEPMSLRNMYDLFYLLYSMNNIVAEYEGRKNENNMYYLQRSENRKRLLDYVHFAMKNDMGFNPEEERFIASLLAQPIERRGKMIWDRYYTLLRNSEFEKKIVGVYGNEFYYDEINRNKINNYSFGELFRILYTSTRIGIFSNSFVKFILASFSFSLPTFVENENYKKKIVNSDDAFDKMVDNFGYTLLGTWRNDLFGSTYDTVNRCRIEIDINQLRKENVKNKDIITALLYLLLLMPCSDKDTVNVKYQKNCKLNIYIDLDPTAFLMNGLLIKKRVNSQLFVLTQYNTDIATSKKGDITLSIKELIDFVISEKGEIDKKDDSAPKNPDNTLGDIIGAFSENYSNCHLSNMFKHMDLVYNVIKRAVSKRIYISPNDLTKREYINEKPTPAEIINGFYKDIYEKLKENDNIYFSNETSSKENNPKFSERFEKSVIYKFFASHSEEQDNKISSTADDESNNDITYNDISKKGISIQLYSENIVGTDVVKLCDLLDSILPNDVIIDGVIEYMMKIRGELFTCINAPLDSDQAREITDVVVTPIIRFMHKIDNDKEDQEELAEEILSYANGAIKAIRKILNLE